MNQQNSQPEKEHRFDPELLKKGLKCDLDQYEMLKHCSDSKNISEWNQWRDKNQNMDIFLEGAYFSEAHLKCASLELQGVEGQRRDVYLKQADFSWANLESAKLMDAHLEKSKFYFANLEDADLSGAYLKSAKFQRIKVDGSTSLWECKVNRYCKDEEFTDFSGVAFDDLSIDPATKQLLEYNIRRQNWKEWYKEHKILQWPVKLFWSFSDYGIDTWRIIKWFVGLAVLFAVIYWLWGLFAPPGIVDNLFVDGNNVKIVWWLAPWRALHFSVVIMTVGFSSMYANAHSFWSHIIIGLQMILGFVLLGALVTRFAVLFTAGGPAGKFEDEKKKTKKSKSEPVSEQYD